MEINEKSVIVGIHKHSIVVTDRKIVYIHHTKNCTKPCDKTDSILTYLEDEMLVEDGYAVGE